MTTCSLHATFSGPDLGAVVLALHEAELFPRHAPVRLSVDFERREPAANWLGELATLSLTSDVHYHFGHNEHIAVVPNRVVNFRIPACELDAAAIARRISDIPFELASFRGMYPEWEVTKLAISPPPHGFSDNHVVFGWGCALRGPGHARLMSRRWLQHGPWLTHTGPNETTVVQFHDLEADAVTAAEQAAAGHARMGISPELGGVLQLRFPLGQEPLGDYVADTRELLIHVYGRTVPPREMYRARAAHALQALGSDMPIDRVVFSFADETEASAHLHELWLRGLGCRTITANGDEMLDESYEPPAAETAQRPEWATAETH